MYNIVSMVFRPNFSCTILCIYGNKFGGATNNTCVKPKEMVMFPIPILNDCSKRI